MSNQFQQKNNNNNIKYICMMNDIKVMNHAADNIRILAASMVEKANSGHPGGAMGGSDFINVLFSEYLVYDPADPTWTGRDRFFLDPGHMSPMLYAGLALRGFFSIEDLKQFRQWGSVTPGHPELDLQRGIENSSGPLGQGHALAAGAAVAEKFLEARLGSTMMQHKIYAYISDGAVEEEISQGVGRIAGNLGLNNLIMFYDSNDIQLSTECGVVMNEDTEMKYKAWGWNVIKINGNDVAQIREATKVPAGQLSCSPPQVPMRTRVRVVCSGFSVRVAKSMFFSASSSLTTMSILSHPIPVLCTVILLPLYVPVMAWNSRLETSHSWVSKWDATRATLPGSPTRITLSATCSGRR
jgi:transketolase N-terminal domain/subunit